MFDLFKKKEAGTPEERLARLGEKQDWAGLSRLYCELGAQAMDRGDLEHAQLWLHRADTIYSADDGVYGQVGETLIEDCSNRIGALEDEDGLLYNAVAAAVEEKAEELSDGQTRVWGLLSMARLVKLGGRLSVLPECGVLGELDWAVDVILRSLQELPGPEEYRRLLDLCSALYELNGKPVYYRGEIQIPGQPAFQLFDLNGMFGVELEIDGYINSCLRYMDSVSRGMYEPGGGELNLVGCTLLPDYYVRTGAGALEEVPQIKAELARIWSDYDFVCSGITWDEVKKRVEEYKKLDILSI